MHPPPCQPEHPVLSFGLSTFRVFAIVIVEPPNCDRRPCPIDRRGRPVGLVSADLGVAMHSPARATRSEPRWARRFQALQAAPDRLLWAVWVRWLVIAGFLSLALVARAFGLFVSVVPCLRAAFVGGGLNAVNEWCVRRGRYVFLVTAIAVPLDHVFITYVVVNTGGAQSPFLTLYFVQVLATAMLVDTLVAAASALWAIGLWVTAVGWQLGGLIEVAALRAAGAEVSATVYHGIWAAFLLYCLALLVYLGGYISERLRASERDLEQRNRRLQEALSSLRAAYERLQQAEVQLIQSEKMRGLGQLVAGIAHELNNPISFVSGNIEHVRDYLGRLCRALEAYAGAALPAAERQRLENLRRELRIDTALADLPGLVDDVEEGARRTKSIVNELRAFSHSDASERWCPADLHRGIDRTLALLAHRLRDHISVHRDFAPLPEVECLPGQLNQVFMNLLANAADAIGDKKGRIWIATEMRTSGTEPVPVATVTISDDGVGMTPEVQARVFEPFFTTKAQGQGTGLGLSVSYAIVERHRGTLTVESRPGGGTAFTIMLPVRRMHTRHTNRC
jgi:signal transduction histidine kinase